MTIPGRMGTAIGGGVFKVFFVKKFLVLSTLFYVLMGWIMMVLGIRCKRSCRRADFRCS